MNAMNERDEPMKGLADYLRASASIAERDYPTAANSGTTLRRWAAEVEASRQRSAVGAEPVANALEALQAVISYFWCAEREPGGLREWEVEGLVRGAESGLRTAIILGTAPSERPAAPAQAGVTDAQAVLTELVACVDGDCSTPEKLAYWEKREAAAWDRARARSLLAGTPPAQSMWQPMETAPRDRDVVFWLRPKTADETWTDSSGKPILMDGKPHWRVCKFKCWPSLWTATNWMEVREIPPPTSGEQKDGGTSK